MIKLMFVSLFGQAQLRDRQDIGRNWAGELWTFALNPSSVCTPIEWGDRPSMCGLAFRTRNSPSQKTSLRWGDCCNNFSSSCHYPLQQHYHRVPQNWVHQRCVPL
jgi:hypothetical protein